MDGYELLVGAKTEPRSSALALNCWTTSPAPIDPFLMGKKKKHLKEVIIKAKCFILDTNFF